MENGKRNGRLPRPFVLFSASTNFLSHSFAPRISFGVTNRARNRSQSPLVFLFINSLKSFLKHSRLSPLLHRRNGRIEERVEKGHGIVCGRTNAIASHCSYKHSVPQFHFPALWIFGCILPPLYSITALPHPVSVTIHTTLKTLRELFHSFALHSHVPLLSLLLNYTL